MDLPDSYAAGRSVPTGSASLPDTRHRPPNAGEGVTATEREVAVLDLALTAITLADSLDQARGIAQAALNREAYRPWPFDDEFGLCLDPCEHPSINGGICAVCEEAVVASFELNEGSSSDG